MSSIAEFLIFGFVPLIVGMLALAPAGDPDLSIADKEKAGAAAPAHQQLIVEETPAQPTISVSENQ